MEKKKENNKQNENFLERLSSHIKAEMALGRMSLESIASEMYITRGQLTRRVNYRNDNPTICYENTPYSCM